jgi:sodium/proline symporter
VKNSLPDGKKKMIKIFVFSAYLVALLMVGGVFYYKSKTSQSFILGNRSINFWVTALSAHASDMSAWLMMGFPAAVFIYGLTELGTTVGLVVGMALSWHFVAPRLRQQSETLKVLTPCSYLGARVEDKKRTVQMTSAFLLVFFLGSYIASGLVGLGRLFETVFQIDYHYGVIAATLVISVYTFLGGFLAVAWNDMIQAVFLLAMLILVPVIAFGKLENMDVVMEHAFSTERSRTFMDSLMLSLSWGLGYFGLPHVLTKFMSIDKPENIRKAKYLGITWQIFVLGAAAAIGLLAHGFVPDIQNPELIFVAMTEGIFPPLLSTIILCSILAAAISTLDSQVMAIASAMVKDFMPFAQKKEIFISRLSIIVICLIACALAWENNASVYSMVHYAWSGLGVSFGPLILWSLTSRSISGTSALVGMITGALIVAFWDLVPEAQHIPAMIPGFAVSFLVIGIEPFLKCFFKNSYKSAGCSL